MSAALSKSSFRTAVPSLTWQGASLAVEAALRRAEQLGIRVNAAVVDCGGTTLSFLRMTGAFAASDDIAVDKAWNAATFGFATDQWMQLIGDSERLRLGLAMRPRVSVIGGGLPIVLDGERVGGIGVSGGTEAEDIDCARAALAALGAAEVTV